MFPIKYTMQEEIHEENIIIPIIRIFCLKDGKLKAICPYFPIL